MNTKKGFSPIIIALILALILGGSFAVYKTFQKNNSTTSKTPDTTVQQNQDTKTYTNEPEDSVISTFKFTGTDQISSQTKDWKTYRNEKYGFEFKYPQEWQINPKSTTENSPTFITDTGSYVFMSVNPITSSRGRTVSIEEYLKDYNYDGNYSREQVDLSGIQILKFSSSSSIRYIVVKDNLKYEFISNWTNSNNSNLMDKVVTTFKFIQNS